jgi:uncharacterized protein YndB with AHSA1/START domain
VTPLGADITMATLVRAPADRVYRALADPVEVNRWFTAESSGVPAAGEVVTWRWRDWGPDKGSAEDDLLVVEADPPRRFVFRWHPAKGPGGEPHRTTVAVDFEPADEGTVVRLRESGYHDTPDDLATCLDCAAGWGEALTLLKFYVEHGVTY